MSRGSKRKRSSGKLVVEGGLDGTRSSCTANGSAKKLTREKELVISMLDQFRLASY